MAGKGKAAVKELGENLIRFAQKGDLGEIKELVDNETDTEFLVASLNFREPKAGIFPLLAAAISDHRETMIYLLEKGANINLMDRAGETVLMKVAERGLRELVIFLIDNGAEVSKASGVEGITALMRASKKGHYETVTFLLEKEAEVDTIDKSGWTALIYAAHAGYTDIVRALIERNVNVNYVEEEAGWTALMYASRYGHTEAVDALLQAGALLEIVDRKRNTALLLACNNRHWGTAELLIEKGVDINAMSDLGDTALMLACLRGSLSTVEALVGKGADLTLANKKGQTAMDFAKQLDIKRALTEFQKVVKPPPPHPAPAKVVVDTTPKDIVSQSGVAHLASEASWRAVADPLSITWAQMNSLIKTTQTEFVSTVSVNNFEQIKESDQQMVVKYHALVLRLWEELVTLAHFYESYAQHLKAALSPSESNPGGYTSDSSNMPSVHFSLMTMANASVATPTGVPPAELSLSQLLVLDFLLENGNIAEDLTTEHVQNAFARWSSWYRSDQVVVRQALQTLAIRRGLASQWISPTSDLSASFIEEIVPRVQLTRHQLIQRFCAKSADSESSLMDKVVQQDKEEVQKITGTTSARQIYVSAYTDMKKLLAFLLSPEHNSVYSAALFLEEAAEAELDSKLDVLVEDVAGVSKPSPLAVAPPPPPPPTAPISRTKVVSEDYTQNPLLHKLSHPDDDEVADDEVVPPPPPPPPTKQAEQQQKPIEKVPAAAASNVNTTPAPAAKPAAAATAPQAKSSKCFCVIS